MPLSYRFNRALIAGSKSPPAAWVDAVAGRGFYRMRLDHRQPWGDGLGLTLQKSMTDLAARRGWKARKSALGTNVQLAFPRHRTGANPTGPHATKVTA